MPLPNVHTLNTVDLPGYSPSVGTTPVAVYVRVPFRCRILKIGSVLGGTITAAAASVACSVNGATAFATHSIPIGGAGQVNTTEPASPTYANEDDYISLTPSGATGSSIPGHFSIVVRAA